MQNLNLVKKEVNFDKKKKKKSEPFDQVCASDLKEG